MATTKLHCMVIALCFASIIAVQARSYDVEPTKYDDHDNGSPAYQPTTTYNHGKQQKVRYENNEDDDRSDNYDGYSSEKYSSDSYSSEPGKYEGGEEHDGYGYAKNGPSYGSSSSSYDNPRGYENVHKTEKRKFVRHIRKYAEDDHDYDKHHDDNYDTRTSYHSNGGYKQY